jgi:hypothetical protein
MRLIEEANKSICPQCRSTLTDANLANPILYVQLLRNLATATKHGFCNNHHEKLTLYCTMCNVELC